MSLPVTAARDRFASLLGETAAAGAFSARRTARPPDLRLEVQGVGPIASLDELAQPDLWESELEYEDFLADLYASRRSEIA